MYKVDITVNNQTLSSDISDSCCTIHNSYKLITSKELGQYIQLLRDTIRVPSLIIYKRTIESMVREWKVHNILYSLHLFRSHTKSVDLNELTCWQEIGYTILSWTYPIYELICKICN